MKPLRNFLLLMLSSFFIPFTSYGQSAVDAGVAAILQHKLDSCVTAFNVPGISAGIILPDERYWNGAAGVSDIYTRQPESPDHLFFQASVTKLFTATLIFQLIEAQQLSLDDSVGTFLPPMQSVPGSTKIRFLLNHRSGLNDVFADPAATANWVHTPDSIWLPEQVIETYNGNPLFSQDMGFSYSNTNYLLLGMIIEQVTGNSFAEVLRNRILIPYQLSQTFFLPSDSLAGPSTKGWTSLSSPNTFDTDAAIVLTPSCTSMGFSAGALVATSSDIARFNRLLFTGEILHDTTLAFMKICTNLNWSHGCNGYGYGTMRYNYHGQQWFGHAGDISGFTLLSLHGETSGITLTLSINRNNAPRGAIALAMLEAIQQSTSVGIGGPLNSPPLFHIYPNPASCVFSLHFSEPQNQLHEAEITNSIGQTIYRQKLEAGQSRYILTPGQQPAGFYFLHLKNGQYRKTKKISLY